MTARSTLSRESVSITLPAMSRGSGVRIPSVCFRSRSAPVGQRSNRLLWNRQLSLGFRRRRLWTVRSMRRLLRKLSNWAGDGVVTPTVRTGEQTGIGIYWAYDGTPSLCAPPRLYNQVATQIADQMALNKDRACASPRAGEHGDGRCRHRDLGIEVLLRFLATGHGYSGGRCGDRADWQRRWQSGDAWRSGFQSAGRSSEQSKSDPTSRRRFPPIPPAMPVLAAPSFRSCENFSVTTIFNSRSFRTSTMV